MGTAMMSKKKISLILLVAIAGIFIFFDQSFEPNDLNELREIAAEKSDILPPKPFATDGCSAWPNIFWGVGIADICIDHDMIYWRGGSAEERKLADLELEKKVNERIYPIGTVMYYGIRLGGHPLVPAPWRWGYGFPYPHGYLKD